MPVQCLCLYNVKYHCMVFTCIFQERRAVTINLVTPFLNYIFYITSQGLNKLYSKYDISNYHATFSY